MEILRQHHLGGIDIAPVIALAKQPRELDLCLPLGATEGHVPSDAPSRHRVPTEIEFYFPTAFSLWTNVTLAHGYPFLRRRLWKRMRWSLEQNSASVRLPVPGPVENSSLQNWHILGPALMLRFFW